MAGSIGNIPLDVGSKSLDALWMRQTVISHNITNSDTPGYVAKSVSFEDQLQSALSDNRINESELSGVNATQIDVAGTSSSGGNGVDLESQMVEMMRNSLQYSYLEKAVSTNLGLLSTAASGGRK